MAQARKSFYLENAFFYYMEQCGDLNAKGSRNNYRSWLRFLNEQHPGKINANITDAVIDDIIAEEETKIGTRNFYNTKRDINNFQSALRKYLDFIQYLNFILQEVKKIQPLGKKIRLEQAKAEIDELMGTIEEVSNFNFNDTNDEEADTEYKITRTVRVGQNVFRAKIIDYWECCAITGFDDSHLLVASHIKPWKDATNEERLDEYNGLLLLPNYDKLFDSGYISFDQDGKIVISSKLSDEQKKILGLSDDIKLRKIDDKHKKYLDYHLNYCFMK